MSKLRALVDRWLTPDLPLPQERSIEEAILLEHYQDIIAVKQLSENQSDLDGKALKAALDELSEPPVEQEIEGLPLSPSRLDPEVSRAPSSLPKSS